MSLDRLKNAKMRTVGSKQTTKALQREQAMVVYVAQDAENKVREPLIKLCKEKQVDIIPVATMMELGRACGIEVGSATAAIIED